MKTKLHKGIKWSWRISSYISMIFFVVFFSIWIKGISGFGFLTTALIILIIWVGFIEIWIKLAYDRWFYEFMPDNLKIERGVIFKRYSSVPYERVQNVDIRRGIIARMLRFSAVNIQTAGYSYVSQGRGFAAEGYIPAVGVDEAERIRNFLMKKISRKPGQGL